MGCYDFGAEAVDDITEACFVEAMRGDIDRLMGRADPVAASVLKEHDPMGGRPVRRAAAGRP